MEIVPEVHTHDLPILLFKSQQKFADWLSEHHEQSAGVSVPSVTSDEAVETALCFGRIDNQKKGFDESFWLQRFTPRKTKNIWSKIIKENAEKLFASGQMQPAGLAALGLAKQDGRWEVAYDSQRTITVLEDFRLS